MTNDKAMELINEWLVLAREVSEMNTGKIPFCKPAHDDCVERMDEIKKIIESYNADMIPEGLA